MADDSKKLTIDDPVSREILNQLDGLQEVLNQLGQQALTLDEEKIRVLAASRRVKEQRQRIFQNILVERGISLETSIKIEASTGKLIIEGGNPAPVEAPVAATEPATTGDS